MASARMRVAPKAKDLRCEIRLLVVRATELLEVVFGTKGPAAHSLSTNLSQVTSCVFVSPSPLSVSLTRGGAFMCALLVFPCVPASASQRATNGGVEKSPSAKYHILLPLLSWRADHQLPIMHGACAHGLRDGPKTRNRQAIFLNQSDIACG